MGGDILLGYTKIPYHMVFDVKFDLQRKAQLVAGENHTVTPREDIFSGVVGMETVCVGFLLATMNGLDICTTDIGNAFLYGHTKEKVYIIVGKEFGALSGEPLIIDKGLYGLQSSGAHFHEHLSQKLSWVIVLPRQTQIFGLSHVALTTSTSLPMWMMYCVLARIL